MQSRVGRRCTTQMAAGVKIETFGEWMRPNANLRGHLTFHVGHEVLHLEMLCRLFERGDTAELVSWIDDQPSGQYFRKAGVLCELAGGARTERAGARGRPQSGSAGRSACRGARF